MKKNLITLLAGFIFGIGLAWSKMIDPDKVLNFLDVTGHWDPSLALVMSGALSVTLIAFRFIPKRAQTLFNTPFKLPTRTDIDASLIVGAIIFGVGWGIAGFCPGPVLASLGFGAVDPIIFVVSMIVGNWTQGYFFNP